MIYYIMEKDLYNLFTSISYYNKGVLEYKTFIFKFFI